MRHHSKRRSVLNPRSAFAPFDGILGRITEPLARAASEIEIPAVNAWLNSPAEKLRAWCRFRDLRKMAAQHLIGRGFVGSVTWGSFEKRMPAIKFEIQGHPETAWFRFKLPFPERILEERLGWEKFLKGLEHGSRLGSLRSEFNQ